MIEDKEKIIEEVRETEHCVEVSGELYVMAENKKDAERYVREQLYNGNGYFVNDLEIVGHDNDE
tara:strand:- start:1059 stop:1250 length:192 start_codon:yes stop_codon:yes gene_type:complete